MKQNTTITLEFNDESLIEANIHQSDQWDDTPKDLTISFLLEHYLQSKIIFQQFPELSNVSYDADMVSEQFQGKIRGEQILFRNDGKIYATFVNDYSGTEYELCINEQVDEYIKLHHSDLIGEDTEEHVFCVHFTSDYRYVNVPTSIVQQGEAAMVEYVDKAFRTRLFFAPLDLDVIMIDYTEKA
ncbi:hypothetical protein [Zophobihabitans entericus]|uniref:Uncharacterized protein n=1 Tax=Zophobihabitans entericus TaxID=1635327 RepID=A0A6G9IE99_9GAMM|nr:hypothetical protein [Zophobihabitans entericus]QIQ22157.1 hypothetical protein IPMB12_10955 [Zophobihabitans entericus]